MPVIFEIIPETVKGKDAPAAFSLGIRMKIGRYESICSITDFLPCESLKSEINSLKNELNEAIKKLESIKNGNAGQGAFSIDSSKPPQEIWALLSVVQDNSVFVEQFNSLNEQKRRELADYIFANCNMFSGKGAFFSARYLQGTALLSA